MTPKPLIPKSAFQEIKDFLTFPFRAIFTHHQIVKTLGLSTLQDDRLLAVWPHLRGRVLDVGAGDNRLVLLYKNGVGVDVYNWEPSLTIIQDAARLPFEEGSFDTVCMLACLNHIPNREKALVEARRVLKPGGRLVLTMIDPWIGYLSHLPHEESHVRGMHEGEVMGLWPSQVRKMVTEAGFVYEKRIPFYYWMNNVYLAAKPL